MHLRYINRLGIPKDIELTAEPLAIGRSRDAAIPLLDEKVSRVHAAIRLSEGTFYLRDLSSRNGTFVNGNRIGAEAVALKSGDRIQIGTTVFAIEDASSKEEAAAAAASVGSDMEEGKGYSTILKEIVEDIPAPAAPAAPAPAAPAPSAPAEPAAPAQPAPPPSPVRKKIVLKLK